MMSLKSYLFIYIKTAIKGNKFVKSYARSQKQDFFFSNLFRPYRSAVLIDKIGFT